MREKINKIRKRLGYWKEILGRNKTVEPRMFQMMDRFLEMINQDEIIYNRGDKSKQ